MWWIVAVAQAATTFGDYSFYAGDPHAHSGWSLDAGASDVGGGCSGECGAWEDFFQTARDNGLDWVVNADHVQGTPTATVDGFANSLRGALDHDDPEGGFVTVPGAETWWIADGSLLGHKTLLMFGDNDTLRPLEERELQPTGGLIYGVEDCGVLGGWIEGLSATYGDVLLIPHHPALTVPMPTDWGCYDARWEPAVEVYSGHGNSLLRAPIFDPPVTGLTPSGSVEAALDPAEYGLRLGFLAGTDSHDTRPGSVCQQDGHHPELATEGGLTLVVLGRGDPFDRGAIHDAIAARRTWATSGPATPAIVRFEALSGVDAAELGEDLTLPEDDVLRVSVEVWPGDADAVFGVELVGNGGLWTLDRAGDGTWSLDLPAADAPAYAYVQVHLDGAALYGDHGCDDGGIDDSEYLWSSPSWITVVPTDFDHDGYSLSMGDCDDADPTVRPGAPERWYDGIDQDCDGASDYDADRDHYDSASWGGIDRDDADPTCAWRCGWSPAALLDRPEAAPVVPSAEPPAASTSPGTGCASVPTRAAFGALVGACAAALRRRRPAG